MLQLATYSSLIPNPGLPRVNGEAHRRKKEVVGPVFSEERLKIYAGTTIHNISELMKAWRPGQTVDVREDLFDLTAKTMADSCLGIDLEVKASLVGGSLLSAKWDYALDFLPLGSFIRALPLPANVRARRNFKAIHALLRKSMLRARGGAERADWIYHLMQAQDQVDPPFTDEEWRDEALDLMLGNLDPLASTLVWCICQIARHESVRDKLEQEADEVLGGRDIAVKDYGRLPYARAVFQEALRLAPPAFFMEREAVEDCDLGGYRIPKGTIVQLCVGLIQRQSRYFEEPMEFKPERWLNGVPSGCPAHAYLPFNYEPRLCAGSEYSAMAGEYLIAAIAQRLRLEPADDKPLEADFKLFCDVRGPQRMLLKARHSRNVP